MATTKKPAAPSRVASGGKTAPLTQVNIEDLGTTVHQSNDTIERMERFNFEEASGWDNNVGPRIRSALKRALVGLIDAEDCPTSLWGEFDPNIIVGVSVTIIRP